MRPLLRPHVALCAALFAILPAFGQSRPPASSACHAIFKGTSTLHDFQGTVDASLVQVAFERNTWRIRIEFPVASMTTQHASRDKNMRKMLEAEKYPLIVVAARDLPYPDRAAPATLTGTLTIRGQEQPGTAMIESFSVKDAIARFTLKGEVSLAAFALKPPSTLLGMVRVGDKVKLEGQITIPDWPQRPSP